MRKLELIPICIGTHESCVECDGDPEHKDASGQKPCSFRHRCRGFQKHLEATGDDEELYIDVQTITSAAIKRDTGWKRTAVSVGVTFDHFIEQMNNWARQYDVPLEPEPEAAPRPKPIAAAKPRQARKASRTKTLNPKLKAMMRHFLDKFSEHVPRKLIRNKRKLILPGDVYLMDRMGTGYLVLRGRTNKGHDRGIVNILPRNQTLTLSLQLGCSMEDFTEACSKDARLKFEKQDQVHSIVGGYFRCEVRRATREQLGLVARALGKLIERGIISLPTD